MAIHQAWLIPFVAFTTGCLTLFVPYTIGGAQNHTDWLLPFISDGGAIAPEACIFSQLLNLTAMLIAISMYIRHRQVVEFYGHRLQRAGKCWRPFSLITLIMGVSACFTCSMVANFSEKQLVHVHSLSAAYTFGIGVLYLWIQTIYSYGMKPRAHSIWVCHLRLLICVMCIAAYVTMYIGPQVDPKDKKSHGVPGRWNPDDVGYKGHLMTTFGEWGLVLSFFCWMFTYIVELRHCIVHSPKVVLKPALLKRTGQLPISILDLNTSKWTTTSNGSENNAYENEL